MSKIAVEARRKSLIRRSPTSQPRSTKGTVFAATCRKPKWRKGARRTPRSASDSRGESSLRLATDLRLDAGEQDWELRFETGRVVIEGVPVPATDSGRDLCYLEWTGERGVTGSVALNAGPNGRDECDVTRFPVGDARIVRYPNGWWNESPEHLADVVVVAGETTRITLR